MNFLSFSQQKWVVANFKLNGTQAFFKEFTEELIASKRGGGASVVHFVLCPPFPYISTIVQTLSAGGRVEGIHLGAQDCSLQDVGAFTGEVSASMLTDVGCSFVLLGHSERRLYHGETDVTVGEKTRKAQEAGLCPIICIGESASVRESGQAVVFVLAQLATILEHLKRPLAPFILAYEPLWAIGTGCVPQPEEIKAMHQALERALRAEGVSDPVLLYGGSVTPENAAVILSCSEVDGLLVGRPCLDIKNLLKLPPVISELRASKI